MRALIDRLLAWLLDEPSMPCKASSPEWGSAVQDAVKARGKR